MVRSFALGLLLATALTAPALLAPAPSRAQAPAPSGQTYSQAQLEQMLAPIALYPDTLLTQVLVAATYPLEIVIADRWLQDPANKALKGDALAKALQGQSWDPSVKSLVPFPEIIKQMNDQLGWTQQLGDAFLGQQKQVMEAVQSLRGRALDSGKLASTPQQKVAVQNKQTGQVQQTVAAGQPPPPFTPATSAIVIEPASPQVVYVPAYNPTVVYGAWPYPAYPPVYYPPPPSYAAASGLAAGLAFGTGVAISSSLWGWGHCNWNTGTVNVNVNQWNNINRNYTQINNNVWQHDSTHRYGTAYNSQNLNAQYRQTNVNNANVNERQNYRGRQSTTQSNTLGSTQTGAGQQARQGREQQPRSQQAGASQRSGEGEGWRGESGGGGSLFDGTGNGKQTRNWSEQGRGSLQGAGLFDRGGGGGGGGGGGFEGFRGGREGFRR